MKKISYLLPIAASIFLSACGDDTSGNGESKSEPPALLSFHQTSEFMVSQVSGLVVPENIYPLISYKPGEMAIAVGDGDFPAGTSWAKYDDDGLEGRLKALELEEGQFNARRDNFGESELSVERNNLLESIKKTRELLQVSEAVEAAGDRAKNLISQEIGEIQNPAVLEAKVKLLEQTLADLEEFGRSREERSKSLGFDIRRSELEAGLDNLNLRLPFSGTVEFSLKTEAGGKLQVTGGQKLGVLIDYSKLYVKIHSSSAGGMIDYSNLFLALPGASLSEASYSHSMIEEMLGNNVMMHYFELVGVDSPRKLTGRKVDGKLIKKFDEKVYVIPKGVLLRWGTGDTWALRLNSIYPNLSYRDEGVSSVAATPSQ